MKIILSRKGFDSKNGCRASPCMPDGTLLSMPIPRPEDKIAYADLTYQGITFDKLLKQLNPKGSYSNCHLDPDIRVDIRSSAPNDWQPAFGQHGTSQGLLRNQAIGENDLFLFFGWFKQVRQMNDGCFRYVRGSPNIHAIWGYLQVGRVLTTPEEIKKHVHHPHSDCQTYGEKGNSLYLARKTLSFDESMLGYGSLRFSENRVLTMGGATKGVWREIPALMPTNIAGERNNHAKGQGIFYKGIWQELVLRQNMETELWAKSILQS